MIEYTTVVGVDKKHLQQLSWTWPTWRKNKPSILDNPMVVFFDRDQVTVHDVHEIVDHPRMEAVAWPPVDHNGQPTHYMGGEGKFADAQRYKMLAGFVHVPRDHVHTPRWLKLDTDVVAVGYDEWIDEAWFVGDPAIVSHRWGFTKPPDQMKLLDDWVLENFDELSVFRGTEPLNLVPVPQAERISHPRIISWCGFFDTAFSCLVADLASLTAGPNLLPVPSQDGFCWYVAKRLGLGVVRANMKARGWQHWSTDHNVHHHSRVALGLEEL